MNNINQQELEQLRRTAEMFEMILQATPGAIENYEILKDAYRKLGDKAKLKEITLRLVNYYRDSGNNDAAEAEMKNAVIDFPDDLDLKKKTDRAGTETVSAQTVFSEAITEYEKRNAECIALRKKVEKLKSQSSNQPYAEKRKHDRELDIESEVRRRADLLGTAWARQAVRHGSIVYRNLKTAYEEQIAVAVQEKSGNLQYTMKTSERLLAELDTEYLKKLSDNPVIIPDMTEEIIEGIRTAVIAEKSGYKPSKDDGGKEIRLILDAIKKTEKARDDALSHAKTAVERLEGKDKSHAEAELAALTGELEVVQLETEPYDEIEHTPAGNRIDDLARMVETGEMPEKDEKIQSIGSKSVPVQKPAIQPVSGVSDTAKKKPVQRPVIDQKTLERDLLLGNILMDKSVITKKNLDEALGIQKETGKSLGTIIIELGYASDPEILNAVAACTGMPYLPLGGYEINKDAVKLIPAETAHRFSIVPLDIISNTLVLAVSAPVTQGMKDELKNCLGGRKITYYLSSPTEIARTLEELYPA